MRGEGKGVGGQAEVVLHDQLFMNEKLAPKAENILRENNGKSAVAVYRVWKNEIVITDIEIDGVSVIDELCIGAMDCAEGKNILPLG